MITYDPVLGISYKEAAFLKEKTKIEKKLRTLNALIMIPVYIAIALMTIFFLWDFISEDYLYFPKKYYLWLSMSLITFTLIPLMARYLEFGSDLDSIKHTMQKMRDIKSSEESLHKQKENSQETAQLKKELEDHKKNLVSLTNEVKNLSEKGVQLSDENVIKNITESITSKSEDEIIKNISDKLSKNNQTSEIKKEVIHRAESSIVRIKKEIEDLKKRGNLNLIAGTMVTAIGLVLLFMFVFNSEAQASDIWSFFTLYAPKLSLVLLIELFAFFFLRLYKSSLDEVKFYQNEITNIETKLSAALICLANNEMSGIKDVIAQLSSTERNFVLEKGQTTVSLEKSRLETQTVTSLSNSLVNAISNRS